MTATIDWAYNGVSGSFFNSDDWAGFQNPGAVDIADLSATGTYTVTAALSATVYGFASTAKATLAVTFGTFIALDGTAGDANAGTVSIGNNTIFEVGGATVAGPMEIINSGTIALKSSGSVTTLLLNSANNTAGEIDLDGTGKLTLSNNSNNIITGDAIFDNEGNTISGAGTIGGGSMKLNNNGGIIDADGSQPLIIIGAGSTILDNTGTYEASSSGTLELVHGTFEGSGTVAAATSGSTVDLEGTTLEFSPTVSTVKGSTLVGIAGTINTLDNVALNNAGSLDIQDQSVLILDSPSAVENTGTIALQSTGDTTELQIENTVGLAGNGKLTLTDSPHNYIISDGAGAVLNNENNTISCAGTIGDSNMILANGGIIDGTGTNALIIAASAGDTLNTGTIESTSTGGVELDGVDIDSSANGLVAANTSGSRLYLVNSTIVKGTVKTVAGATIAITGTSEIGNSSTVFDNAGTTQLNNGSTLVLGAGTVDNTGTIDLNAALNATYLQIVGNVTLNGTGKVILSATGFAQILTNNSMATLNNNSTIIGAGSIDDSNLTFNNGTKGLVEETGSNPIFINTGNSFVNDGTLESDGSGGIQVFSPITNNGKVIADAGLLEFQSTFAGTGSLTIGGSGKIDVGTNNAGLAMNTTFAAGAAGTLELAASATTTPTSVYDGTISGFGINDAIDLSGLAYGSSMTVAAHFAGGVTTLTVGNGTDTVALKFAGNLASDTFVLGDDGGGGTRVTDPPGRPVWGASNMALLGSYMASAFTAAEAPVGAPAPQTASNEMVLHAHTG